jgi:hypothetical protein
MRVTSHVAAASLYGVYVKPFLAMMNSSVQTTVLYLQEIMERKRRELEEKTKKMNEMAQKRSELMQRRVEEQRRLIFVGFRYTDSFLVCRVFG